MRFANRSEQDTWDNFCADQLDRLSNMTRFPQTDDALREAYRTLADVGRSKDHVRRIVETVKYNTAFPDYETIRTVAWNLLAESEQSVKCVRCKNTRFVSVKRTRYGVEYECSQPCPDCHVDAQQAATTEPRKLDTKMPHASEIVKTLR